MFTGIISAIGTIMDIQEKNGSLQARISCPYDAASIQLGASIACNGMCLTVTSLENTKEGCQFSVDISPESIAVTQAGQWQNGTLLNLERALKIGDELGGHLVTGHVDGLSEILHIQPMGDSYRIELAAPATLARFIAAKGSVTLDGISLTVNGVEQNRFWVQIIPHTWTNTNLHTRKPGDKLQLEIDVLARYIARMQEYGTQP
ncbi:riboflavin synthase [bacterium]|nr:riboflavin synthase [bacterium]